jgi:hypothetical protein
MSAIRSFLKIENTKIGFRNFAGKVNQYNPAGKSSFCVFIDEENAEGLRADGWNIRWREPRNPDDDRQAYLPVAVSFDFYPPEIWVITSRGKTKLKEEDIKILDWAEIEVADITIRPYNWTQPGGKSGIKAYVKSLYVTVIEDELSEKYRDVPDSANSEIDDEPSF